MNYKTVITDIVKGLFLSCLLLAASCEKENEIDADATYSYEFSPEATIADCKAQSFSITVNPKDTGGNKKNEWYIHEIQEDDQQNPTYLDIRNQVSDYNGEWYRINNVDYSSIEVTLTENTSESSRSVKVGIQGSPMFTCYFTITQQGKGGELTYNTHGPLQRQGVRDGSSLRR